MLSSYPRANPVLIPSYGIGGPFVNVPDGNTAPDSSPPEIKYGHSACHEQAEIVCGFLGLTFASLKCFISALPLHTTHRGEQVQLPSHSTLGLQRNLPNVLHREGSQHLPPAATRQCLLREGGTAPPWGAQGSEELIQAVSEQGLGLLTRQPHEPHREPKAVLAALQLPCCGVSGNGDYRANLMGTWRAAQQPGHLWADHSNCPKGDTKPS